MANPRILVIAGSDSSGGAGIQADLKTAQTFGVYVQTAVTAVTVQNTHGVTAVHPVPAAIVRGQILAALNDIGADAIKIGMLGNAEIAACVADVLSETEEIRAIPLVLDTVMLSSSGAPLLDEAGVEILKKRLIRRSLVVTPNLPETEAISGVYPRSDHRLRNAAMAFKILGAANVLFKGGHGDGDIVRDTLWTGAEEFVPFESPRQATHHTHGTGCTLATAIASGIAQGKPLIDAVERAHLFVQNAIRTAPQLGGGAGPLNHKG
ncbi:MAG TPA: bifunctional hydroxymethylpyrimidine kinase/phosphomethylpyrimidine kinase [Rhizomicrobium sp.]|jgi:hydroxymethylpyrimidine/phosphomethylpyrimidine kinase